MEGVKHYTTKLAKIEVNFPEDKVVCSNCWLCRYEDGFKRYSCRATMETLLAPFSQVGFNCPLYDPPEEEEVQTSLTGFEQAEEEEPEQKPERMTLAMLREEKGFSSKGAARRIGVSPQTMMRWEHGAYMPKSIKYAERLADLYGVTATEIYTIMAGGAET